MKKSMTVIPGIIICMAMLLAGCTLTFSKPSMYFNGKWVTMPCTYSDAFDGWTPVGGSVNPDDIIPANSRETNRIILEDSKSGARLFVRIDNNDGTDKKASECDVTGITVSSTDGGISPDIKFALNGEVMWGSSANAIKRVLGCPAHESVQNNKSKAVLSYKQAFTNMYMDFTVDNSRGLEELAVYCAE